MPHVLCRYERQRLAHGSAKEGTELTCQLRDGDIDVREMAVLLNAHRDLMARVAISRRLCYTRRWFADDIGDDRGLISVLDEKTKAKSDALVHIFCVSGAQSCFLMLCVCSRRCLWSLYTHISIPGLVTETLRYQPFTQ